MNSLLDVSIYCRIGDVCPKKPGDECFSDWPGNTDPKVVAKKHACHFVGSDHRYGPTIHNSETLTAGSQAN